MLICMTDSTITNAAEEDEVTISGLSLDEMDGANYVRKTLAGKAVTKDDTNNRAFFTSDAVAWTSLGAGTRSMKGVLIYKNVSGDNDATNIPLFWIDGGFPIAANGTTYTLTPAGTGWVYLQ